MQEHPVPQNVTGYEFHLIGQMTLKQFMEVAGGIIFAVLVNTTNLPNFLKYPIMFVLGLSGAALAFIPFEGRPLDRWFFAFVKAIYQPTMFFWKKSNPVPEPFTYVSYTQVSSTIEIDYKPIRQSRVKDYISSISTTHAQSDLTDEEKQAQEILGLFSQPSPVISPTVQNVSSPFVSAPPVRVQSAQILVAKQSEDVQIPEAKPTVIEKTSELPTVETVTAQQTQSIRNAPMTEIYNQASKDMNAPSTTVSTDASLPFPSKPTTPNMIVGMVVSTDKKILENAIVTIAKKSDRTPVRALKTNALGQFSVITPLENGEYIIVAEKEGFTFSEELLTVNNAVIDPLLLQAHS